MRVGGVVWGGAGAPLNTSFLKTIHCTIFLSTKGPPVADFEKFLKERIKVSGKTGNLGEKVAVSKDGTVLPHYDCFLCGLAWFGMGPRRTVHSSPGDSALAFWVGSYYWIQKA